MSLKGAFAKVQKVGAQSYLKLAQLFEENPLIRETWVMMAQDLNQQAESLEGLPSRFWKMLKSDEEALLREIHECHSLQTIKKTDDRFLHSCFMRCLDVEQPLILRAYVPLIRLLRTEWSDHALDFYIMVKSHMARISRIIQPFSVDPALISRVQNLHQRFEFEVQRIAVAELTHHKMTALKKTGVRSASVSKRPAKSRSVLRATKRALHLSKRVQRMAKRAKPLVHKLDLARRRARR